MKKKLFVNFNCYWNPHFETELELMHQSQLNGDKVYSLNCRGELMQSCASAMFNPTKKKFCKRCQKRYDIGCKIISLPKNQRYQLKTPDTYPKYVTAKYHSMDEVKAVNYDGINIGFSIFENILLVNNAINVDLSTIHNELETALKISYIVYSNFKRLCDEILPDEVIVFNGKHQEYEPILSYCELHKIDYYFHERGADPTKYMICKNKRHHKIQTMIDIINTYSADYTKDKENIAKSWFENRRVGNDKTWISFTKDQKVNLLPDNFNPEIINVSFFDSSLWEVINYEGWLPPECFKDEIYVIEETCKKFLNDSNYHFYLRIHPNIGLDPNDQLEKLLQFKQNNPYSNLTIIAPDDEIDTYELIIQSSVNVIPYNSTVGVESCYWETPVILLGKSMYQHLDVCYTPKTFDEYIELLRRKTLKPKPKENSLLYGYAMNTRGTDFKFYKPIDLFEGEFLGINLKNEVKFKNRLKRQLAKLLK